jgi:hypothetical protein
MYIPDLRDITERNFYYSKNEATGMFDTRDSAQIILQSMAEAHGEQLKALPQQLEGGKGTLLDLCTLTEHAPDVRTIAPYCFDSSCGFCLRMPEQSELWRLPLNLHPILRFSICIACWQYTCGSHLAPCTQASFCNAVVRLKLELYRLPAATRSAILLDGYNSLFFKSEFWETHVKPGTLDGPLRSVDAQELTLCANLRVLSDPDLPLQLDKEAAPFTKFFVPLMDVTEVGTALLYYR